MFTETLYEAQRIHGLTNLAERELPRKRAADGEHRYRRARRLEPDEVAQLVAAYESGRTVYELSEQFGIHRDTVASLLKREGVTLRFRSLTDAEIDEAQRLQMNGGSIRDYADSIGVHRSTVWSALRRRQSSSPSGDDVASRNPS